MAVLQILRKQRIEKLNKIKTFENFHQKEFIYNFNAVLFATRWKDNLPSFC